MERFQQENRHSGPVSVGIWDGGFAPSTLQRRDPKGSQNALSTRDSRVGDKKGSQSTRKPAATTFGDEDNSSADELDMFRDPHIRKKPTSQEKRASQMVMKSKKAETTSNEPSRPAKARPATGLVKPSKKKKKKGTSDSEDEIAMTPVRPMVNKKAVKKPDPPKASAPGRAKKDIGNSAKESEEEIWKKKPTMDIEEITASEEESVDDVVREKVTPRRRGPLKSHYTPRPFPMDLSDSPMAGSSRATSSTPQTVSIRTKPVNSSNTRRLQKDIESAESSESDSGEPKFTYTQAVRLNEVDPNTLCPFCDDKLPEVPSTILLNMLEKFKLKAKPDPRYGNSLGLKLDMSQYISFCSRHTAESEEFPRGQKYGWPATLDAHKLGNRIWKLQPQLQEIIDDPEEGTFFAPLQETALKYGKGAVTGAKGSWATFENATTGYYGEQGLALITQVLFDMFPSIPSQKISPLDLASYYSLVLVPETALLLIRDDLQKKKGNDEIVTRSQALKTLRKSTKYGLAIFPVADGDQPNAGDDIARRRARKMRKLRDQEAEDELRMTSSQATEIDTDGIVLDLSSDPEPVDAQKTPVQRKRKAQPSPLDDVNVGIKAIKRRAQDNAFRKSVETPSVPPVERKVSKKRNLTGQPGALAWSDGSAASSAVKPLTATPPKEDFSWLISPGS